MDQERRLMFSRTPGRIRKLLRNVSGMGGLPLKVGRVLSTPSAYPGSVN
jgi:hypothetical protein